MKNNLGKAKIVNMKNEKQDLPKWVKEINEYVKHLKSKKKNNN